MSSKTIKKEELAKKLRENLLRRKAKTRKQVEKKNDKKTS